MLLRHNMPTKIVVLVVLSSGICSYITNSDGHPKRHLLLSEYLFVDAIPNMIRTKFPSGCSSLITTKSPYHMVFTARCNFAFS